MGKGKERGKRGKRESKRRERQADAAVKVEYDGGGRWVGREVETDRARKKRGERVADGMSRWYERRQGGTQQPGAC